MRCRCCGRRYSLVYIGKGYYTCEPAIGGCGHAGKPIEDNPENTKADTEKAEYDGK